MMTLEHISSKTKQMCSMERNFSRKCLPMPKPVPVLPPTSWTCWPTCFSSLTTFCARYRFLPMSSTSRWDWRCRHRRRVYVWKNRSNLELHSGGLNTEHWNSEAIWKPNILIFGFQMVKKQNGSHFKILIFGFQMVKKQNGSHFVWFGSNFVQISSHHSKTDWNNNCKVL